MTISQLKPTKSITFYALTGSSIDDASPRTYGVRTDYEIIEGTGKKALKLIGTLLSPFYFQNPKTDIYNCIPKITTQGYRKLSKTEENIFMSALQNPNNSNPLKRVDSVYIDLIITSIYLSNKKHSTNKSQQ